MTTVTNLVDQVVVGAVPHAGGDGFAGPAAEKVVQHPAAGTVRLRLRVGAADCVEPAALAGSGRSCAPPNATHQVQE